ncbi:ferrous iron transport protein B, partial [Streptococcus suis]
AAIGAIVRDIGVAMWTWFAMGFQTGLGYASSLVIYHIGLVLIHGQLPTVCTFIDIFLIITAIYSLLKKQTNTLTN